MGSEHLILPGRELSLLAQELEELRLARSVGLHELDQIAVLMGCRRETHELRKLLSKTGEGPCELRRSWRRFIGPDLETSGEAGGPVGVRTERSLYGELDLPPPERHRTIEGSARTKRTRGIEQAGGCGPVPFVHSITWGDLIPYGNYKSGPALDGAVTPMDAERSHRSPRPNSALDASCDSAAMQGHNLCPVLASVGVIGTEWRLAIIHRLLEGPQRFSEILKSNARLNAKTLSATLKYLENQGVVQRHVISTRPFSVTYSLTEMGMGLAPVARELRAWGERWLVPRATPSGRAGTNPRRTPAIQGELPRVVLADTDGHRTR